MNKDKNLFCVRFILFVCMAGIPGQIFLPSIGYSSTGEGSPPSGATLVKEQLSHILPAPSSRHIKSYIIQPGDVFCDILVKAGITKKDALYIAKKANSVFRLTKMRPGSELELYISPDGTGLQEVDYKVSNTKKVVLYNGRVIAITQDAPEPAPSPASSRITHKSKEPAAAHKETRQAARTPSKSQSATSVNQPLKSRSAVVRTCIPQTVRTAVVNPASGIKTFSSYNCGLPESIPPKTQTPYELLASGLVLSPLFPPLDKDGLKPMTDKPENGPDQDKPSSKQKPADRKRETLLKKRASAKKYRHECIAKPSEPPFLRVPLAYRRVSSPFSYSRVDPFTNEAQPHLGVDLSAPQGTPVHSIGAGRVQYVGWDGGYGKTIRIVHNNGYISQYGHLSHFARDMVMGKRVRKGETIGYVGMTGMATGPHLDFRVTHNGTYLNPMKLDYSPRKLTAKRGSGKTRNASRG